MTGVNRVTLVGRAGNKPENKNGVTKFSIATSEKYKDKSGQQVEKTEWHSLVFFGKLAEIAAQYLNKGSLIYVEGRLQTSKWDDKDGKTNYKTDIIVSTMQMLGGKEKGSEGSQPLSFESNALQYDYMHVKNAAKNKNPMYAPQDASLDDLPF